MYTKGRYSTQLDWSSFLVGMQRQLTPSPLTSGEVRLPAV